MSRDQSPSRWLTHEEQRAWRAFLRLQLRLSFEMNRQLQTDSELSLPDYHVLVALSEAAEPLGLTSLAAELGWERSRLSHHLARMCARGLTRRSTSALDRRSRHVTLTDQGRAAVQKAAPGHVDLVRGLFFGGLSDDLLPPLVQALEQVYDHICASGSLPKPSD